MKAYLSGKISGLPMGLVRAKFEAAEQYLASKGYEVVNPCKLDHSQNKEWSDHMKTDLRAMMDCDVIGLLPCWMDSPGARVEFNLAVTLNFAVISLEGML